MSLVLSGDSPNLTSATLTTPTITTPTITGGTLSSPTITTPTLNSPTINTPTMGGSVITNGTAVASTSGTSIDFTGIPSWVKSITVIFNGVSLNASSAPLIQLGTSGGIISTGYSSSSYQNVGNASISSTAGFCIYENTSGQECSGSYVINLLSSGIWAGGGNHCRETSPAMKVSAGRLTGAGTIDRVRITTVNGTDTFDAGSINIQYG